MEEQGIQRNRLRPLIFFENFNNDTENDKNKSDSVYSGINPLVGDDIAKVISYVIDCPENVNISDITVLAKSQASSTVINRKND